MSTEVLAALPLLGDLGLDQLRRLAPLFQLVDFPAGAEIFSAGDRANRLYFVCAGEVTIRFRPYDGEVLDIAHIPPGGAFGWSAALKRAHYTASAVAQTAVQAMVIEARDLHRIMATDPELSTKLLERAAQLAGSRLDGLGRQIIGLLKSQQPPHSD